MATKKPSELNKSPFELLLQILNEARDCSMHKRKSRIQEQFMIARRVLTDSYKEFAPEDMPIDLQRLQRDLAVTRDNAIDEECTEIDRTFRLVTQVLSIVAEENPDYFQRSARQVGIDSKKLSAQRLKHVPRTTLVLPTTVISALSPQEQTQIVQIILRNEHPLFNDILAEMHIEGKDKIVGIKKLLNFLVRYGHAEKSGALRRGTRYVPTKTLKSFAKLLGV